MKNIDNLTFGYTAVADLPIKVPRDIIFIKKYMNILKDLRIQLQKSIDPQSQKTYARFFKEPVKFYGIPSATLKKIAKAKRKDIKDLDKETIF